MFASPNNNSNKGFTIIELLVVIAVIALISSMVLVSMRGSTGKARISKSLEFSQTTMNIIGVDAVGIWSFDEGSGPTAFDKSGYGNNGTIHGATFVSGDENTPHWHVNEGEGRSALEFDATDYVEISNSSSLPDDINKVTLEVWVKPSVEQVSAGRHGTFIIRYSVYPWFLRVYNDNRFEFDIYSSGEHNIFSTTKITADRWYHVVGTYDGSTSFLYINGVKESEQTFNLSIRSSDSPIYIGKWPGQEFHGLIDEVRIYASALSSAEIQQHYADGVQKHNLALK